MDRLERLKEVVEDYGKSVIDPNMFISSLKEVTEIVRKSPDTIGESQKANLINLAYEFFAILEIQKTASPFSDRKVISAIEEFIDAVFDMEDRESETIQEILTASIKGILKRKRTKQNS